MKRQFLTILIFIIVSSVFAQDTTIYKFRAQLSIPYKHVQMQQSLSTSSTLYEISNVGIDKLGDRFFLKNKTSTTRKISNFIFKYTLGFAFSKYASELPITLGIWAHEEFHSSVLNSKNISNKNGNWLFNRWDGTVYGITDSALSNLKRTDLNSLLYSYVAGVQYEIALNKQISIDQFYKKRKWNNNALLLYNALYVYDYFNFSTSDLSDSVKIFAPKYESKDPKERDFAGADLTAWIYDMFNPKQEFYLRDSFPKGEGVNRRIGYSDLSTVGQKYLKNQKKLALLNFINPSIVFVNNIKINEYMSFNFFTQYVPTHFGNSIGLFIPFKYKTYDFLINMQQYNNKSTSFGRICTG